MSTPGSMLGQTALNNLTSNFSSNISGYNNVSADLMQTQQTFESPSSRAKNDIFESTGTSFGF